MDEHLSSKGKFYDYYLTGKDKYYDKYENQGIKIVPASSSPKNDGERYEPQGVIAEGHVQKRAMRKSAAISGSQRETALGSSSLGPVTSPSRVACCCNRGSGCPTIVRG